MSELNGYIATFNCGRTLVDVDFFASNFFNALNTNAPPDLVVLCLQEIAPLGYSFLGGSFLTPYFDRLTTAIHVAVEKRFETENAYERILVRNVGMTALMIFAKRDMVERIRWIETAGVGVGVSEMGNKGAVAARLGLQSQEETVPLTFVAAHLAPMEDAWKQRNEDWKKICEGLVFERDGAVVKPGKNNEEAGTLLSSSSGAEQNESIRTGGSLFSPNSHIFFSGDLNYRTSDTSPKPEDIGNWPQPVESVSDVHHYSHMLEHDQLNRERQKGNTLHHLAESDITFPPTYKYSDAARQQAARASLKHETSDDHVWLWAKHRVPSWCDRILYLDATPPIVHSYTALPVQPTSDHRPVVMSFSLPLEPLSDTVAIEPPFPIRKDWREARAAAKRNELIVGFAAFLALTWEGEALLGGTIIGLVGGYLALQALIT